MIVIGVSCARTTDEDGFEFHGERSSLIECLEFGIRKLHLDVTTVLLPLSWDVDVCRRRFFLCDAIVLPGGVDVLPESYGEKKSRHVRETDRIDDQTELNYARWALRSEVPILGICRGMHLLAIASGASLIQDLEAERSAGRHDYAHRNDWATAPAHEVVLDPGSLIHGLLGNKPQVSKQLMVTSGHHQAIDDRDHLPEHLRIVARDPQDEIVEAVEVEGHPFALGVQWHPEFDLEHDPDSLQLEIFKGLIRAALDFHENRR